MTTQASGSPLQTWLSAFIDQFGGTSGTVHLRDVDSDLQLAASHNIPARVLDLVAVIPVGKGMAGLAWQRDQAVSTCNLKTDESGDVRPGAKAVDARGAVALPIHAEGRVAGVVGIAFADERTITEEELRLMSEFAEAAPRSA